MNLHLTWPYDSLIKFFVWKTMLNLCTPITVFTVINTYLQLSDFSVTERPLNTIVTIRYNEPLRHEQAEA